MLNQVDTPTALAALLKQIKRFDIEADYVLIRFNKPVKLSVDEYRALLKASGGKLEHPLRKFREDE